MNLRTITHGRYRTNTYVVDDEHSGLALVIDPTENPDGIADFVHGAGLRVAAVVSTHSHFDHVGGVAGIRRRLQVPFMIGRLAAPSLRQEAARAKESGVEIEAPPPPDRLLDDGDTVKVGALRFEVLLVPGHSPGDIALYERDAQVVFTGDTLHWGEIGRYNQGCDEALLVDSIDSKLMTLPDEVAVYAGHGPRTTIGRERAENRGLKGLPRQT